MTNVVFNKDQRYNLETPLGNRNVKRRNQDLEPLAKENDEILNSKLEDPNQEEASNAYEIIKKETNPTGKWRSVTFRNIASNKATPIKDNIQILKEVKQDLEFNVESLRKGSEISKTPSQNINCLGIIAPRRERILSIQSEVSKPITSSKLINSPTNISIVTDNFGINSNSIRESNRERIREQIRKSVIIPTLKAYEEQVLSKKEKL